MNWIVLGGSLAAVLVLAGIAWALRLGRDGRIDSVEEAADAAEHALAGFATQGAVVGADGLAALAIGTDGRVAAMKRHGAHIAVREVPWSAVRAAPGGIIVETEERRFGNVAIAGVDALDVRRLAPTGDVRRLAPTGDVRRLAPTGDVRRLAPTGDVRRLAPTGDVSRLAPAGEMRKPDPQPTAG